MEERQVREEEVVSAVELVAFPFLLEVEWEVWFPLVAEEEEEHSCKRQSVDAVHRPFPFRTVDSNCIPEEEEVKTCDNLPAQVLPAVCRSAAFPARYCTCCVAAAVDANCNY